MKKRLALVLAGVMMVSSLAGCGSSKPAETAAAAGETTAAAADAKADTTEAAKSDAAPELELIIASNQTSLDNPYSYGMDKFKEVVEDVSGGKIAVTVHKGTLGENENELIEKLEIVDMGTGNGRCIYGSCFPRFHDRYRCSGSRYLLTGISV